MPPREDAAHVQLKIRMREKLRKQIEEASKFNDRSMNEEMIERLTRSFTIESDRYEMFGGEYFRKILRNIGLLIERTVDLHGNQDNKRAQVIAAIVAYMQAIGGGKATELLDRARDGEGEEGDGGGDAWQRAATQLLVFTEGVSPAEAEYLIEKGNTEGLPEEMKGWRRLSLAEIMKR